MTENIIGRVEILILQKRYVEAEALLSDLLRGNPVDVRILALLAEVNLQQDKIEDAYTLINTAIGVSPDFGHLFYIKARIEIQKKAYDEAEKNIEQSLALDPSDADFYSFWASIKLTRKQYQPALELANKALEFDSENILGLNVRSTALLKLNRKEDSYTTIEGALRGDPNNAYTHSNYGWSLLEKGDNKKALMHFREALKNDPNFDYAKAGMIEALKANNILYKVFLKYAFWISNLTAKYQWGVIIGFYLCFRVLKYITETNATLQPYLTPLIVLMSIIAFSTWIITPISNLFLRLNKYGKHLLNKKEIMSSNFVGISCLIFIMGVVGYFVVHNDSFLSLAVFGFAMMLPYSVMFSPSKYKNSLVIYAGAMTLIGLAAIFSVFKTGDMNNPFVPIFVFGFIAFQWAANFLLIRQSNV